MNTGTGETGQKGTTKTTTPREKRISRGVSVQLYEQDTLRYRGIPYRYNLGHLGHRYRVSTHSLPHPLKCDSTLQVVSQSYSKRWAPTKTSVPPPASNKNASDNTPRAHIDRVTEYTLHIGASTITFVNSRLPAPADGWSFTT